MTVKIHTMNDERKYHFRIGALSPKTMPLGRLLEYLIQFNKLLDNSDKVHLLAIENGSTAPAFYIEPRYEDECVQKLQEVAAGLGTEAQNRAYREIRYMADEDRADGTQFEDPHGSNIIPFPMVARPESVESEIIVEGIEESATVFASVYKLGRNKPNSRKYDAWFSDLKNGKPIRAEMPVDLGVKMGSYLEKELCIKGVAIWKRDETGTWIVDKLKVAAFEEFHPKTPNETFIAIESAKDALPEDIQDKLNKHRIGE